MTNTSLLCLFYMTSLFSFSGIVFRHLGRGKALGYPTANVKVAPNTPEGIFAGIAKLGEESFHALIFVGRPLTFDESDKKAEVHILDFDRDIYDQVLEVESHFKLRDNIKFESKEDLIKQMEIDEQRAREWFSDSQLV